MTLLQKLDRLPPYAVRLLARRRNRLILDVEIMKQTGWSKRRLRRVSRSTSWSGVKVSEVDAFLTACGMSWSKQRRHRGLLMRLASTSVYMRHMRYRYGSKRGWYAVALQSHRRQFEKVLVELARNQQ